MLPIINTHMHKGFMVQGVSWKWSASPYGNDAKVFKKIYRLMKRYNLLHESIYPFVADQYNTISSCYGHYNDIVRELRINYENSHSEHIGSSDKIITYGYTSINTKKILPIALHIREHENFMHLVTYNIPNNKDNMPYIIILILLCNVINIVAYNIIVGDINPRLVIGFDRKYTLQCRIKILFDALIKFDEDISSFIAEKSHKQWITNILGTSVINYKFKKLKKMITKIFINTIT